MGIIYRLLDKEAEEPTHIARQSIPVSKLVDDSTL